MEELKRLLHRQLQLLEKESEKDGLTIDERIKSGNQV